MKQKAINDPTKHQQEEFKDIAEQNLIIAADIDKLTKNQV